MIRPISFNRKKTETMELLAKLFGSLNKVKILRFFAFNAEGVFALEDIARTLKISAPAIRREMVALEAIHFVDSKIAVKVNARGNRKIKSKTWQLDTTFPFLTELRKILTSDVIDRRADIARRFKKSGKIQVIILSGFFLDDPAGRADLTVVGDNLNRRQVERTIHQLEAEIGKELKYAVLDTADFNFRLFAGDKFIRDIMDYPYQFAVNKLNLS